MAILASAQLLANAKSCARGRHSWTSYAEENCNEAHCLDDGRGRDGGAGVVRHTKGAMAYIHNADSKNNLKIENGKVVGFAGSGAGRNMLVTGAASPYANKAFRYTFRSTGFNQFVVDVMMGE